MVARPIRPNRVVGAGVGSAVSKVVMRPVSCAAAKSSRLPAPECQAVSWSSPAVTVFCRGGTQVADTECGSHLVKIAHADEHIEVIPEQGLEGMTGDVRMLPAVREEPLAHHWRQLIT